MNEFDELDEAIVIVVISAWRRFCEKQGTVFSQPSRALMRGDGRYIYLENVNGPMAKYELRTGRIVAYAHQVGERRA